MAVPGGRVWYQVVGAGGATPLLVVHGGPGFPHDYLEPLASLGDERPVIFYDQLGCGWSDRPAHPALWRLGRFVAELAQVRTALRLARVHLLGHSCGAMLAVDYALARPPGLASLVLASPLLSTERWLADQAAYRRALPPELQAVLDHHEAAGTTASPEYQEAAMRYYHRHVCRLDPWPGLLQRAFAGAGADVYLTMWGPSEFYCTGNLRDYDRTPRLRELAVPTLFTCGRYDEAAPATVAWYQSLVPGAELAVFEHSAHMPHLEEPERFLAVLRAFLARADAARGSG